MTNKREPFAKVFEYGINVGEIEVYSESDDKEVVAQINAAFNARVDDEVKKAVEEFRERVSVFYEQSNFVAWDGLMSFSRKDIANKIRNLPTEPEGKP